ncbi:hypothetical protein D7S86_25010 [Pararobbsia silviterrae]|uniref:Uncharacterized protein n=2 Tax=Pararobbsia silviterrae TaxID=1792498 RepID=A0A494XF03_9BURK|nr:hypothetical protein D7S86_25010 [Pararobbsia silviterrae]
MRIFDEAFYVSCYREFIPAGVAPLEHFLEFGEKLGYKPNAYFDPLLYLIVVPESRSGGALIHYLEHAVDEGGDEIDLTISAVLPVPVSYVPQQPDDMQARDREDNLAYSRQFGLAETLRFRVDEREYSLIALSADAFFERLESNQACAYPRLPHGFWDCVHNLQTARALLSSWLVERQLQNIFTDAQIDRLAARAFDAFLPEMGVYNENFLDELFQGIRTETVSPDYFRSVSFKWQPTIAHRIFGRTDAIGEMESTQLRTFADLFGADSPVYESMIWKRWVYSGDIKRLPVFARSRPVVLVGANRVKALGERWKLPSFTHLEIPLLSYNQRYAILDLCKAATIEAKAEAKRIGSGPPLIMLQGGSLACWLIARLHHWDPAVFYLDFGQSLHIWFLDNQELWMHWLKFHPRLVMENCELDAFYEELGIALEAPFARPAISDTA